MHTQSSNPGAVRGAPRVGGGLLPTTLEVTLSRICGGREPRRRRAAFSHHEAAAALRFRLRRGEVCQRRPASFLESRTRELAPVQRPPVVRASLGRGFGGRAKCCKTPASASREVPFQAQKFAGAEYMEHIARARTPKEAAERGRNRSAPLRSDWEAIKDDVMRAAVRRKFETHADIRAVLLGAGDEELVESAPGDYYWGCGADGSGRNMLGRILMEVRAALRGNEAEPAATAAPPRN